MKNLPKIDSSKNRFGCSFFLPTVGAFLLTVELLCLQPVDVLLRHTFPL